MVRPDDYSLSRQKRLLIREHVVRSLKKANALGVVPTPIDEVLRSAKVEVADLPEEHETFLAMLRRKSKEAGMAFLRAIGKTLGIFHAAARIIYLDKTLHAAKRPFLKLHETGHAVLPWQNSAFGITEDCDKTLAPDIAVEFEREASSFAADVIFQLDRFTEEAHDHVFGISVPLKLKYRYRSSVYMAMRRYVAQHHRACAVLVLEPPVPCEVNGFVAELRRVVVSDEFNLQFGQLAWPESFGPDDEIGAVIPVNGRKMSKPREFTLISRNGVRYRCIAEAFTQGYQVFVLIHAVTTLTRTTVLVS